MTQFTDVFKNKKIPNFGILDICLFLLWAPEGIGQRNSLIIYVLFENMFKTPSLQNRKKYGAEVFRERSPPSTSKLINISFIHSVGHSFSFSLQGIINPKLLELGSWIFERMFTPQYVSHVTYQVSRVKCPASPSGVMSHKKNLQVIFNFFSPTIWWR